MIETIKTTRQKETTLVLRPDELRAIIEKHIQLRYDTSGCDIDFECSSGGILQGVEVNLKEVAIVESQDVNKEWSE